MLSDRLPFSVEGSAFAIQQSRLNSVPAPLTGVPAPLAEVVMRGLAREPEDRQSSAEELGVAIARVAYASFGTDWLDQADLRLLTPDAILAAATGRPSRPREPEGPRDDATRIVHRPPVEGDDETRVVSAPRATPGDHEVEDEYPGAVAGDLVPDSQPVGPTSTETETPQQTTPKRPDPAPADPRPPTLLGVGLELWSRQLLVW